MALPLNMTGVIHPRKKEVKKKTQGILRKKTSTVKYSSKCFKKTKTQNHLIFPRLLGFK